MSIFMKNVLIFKITVLIETLKNKVQLDTVNFTLMNKLYNFFKFHRLIGSTKSTLATPLMLSMLICKECSLHNINTAGCVPP